MADSSIDELISNTKRGVTAADIKSSIVRQLQQIMMDDSVSKAKLARLMETSRPAVDRLLDPANTSVTLGTLERASKALGRDFRIDFLSHWLDESSSREVFPTVFIQEIRNTAEGARSRFQRIQGSVFEVDAETISMLDEHEIVELVRRLVFAELVDAGIQLSSARVPAQIHIPDGGEDGRVDWQGGPTNTHYLPSRFCIFQCKKSDPKPSKLRSEVQSQRKGKAALKPAFEELLDRGGTYVLVTSAPVVRVRPRVDAIKNSIKEAGGNPDKLTSIKIYGANELADWASIHPSVSLWVNSLRRKESLAGFLPYERWAADGELNLVKFVQQGQGRFQLNGKAAAFLLARQNGDSQSIGFEEAQRHVGNFLSKPGRALRIVGPSGYGKTRLMFELLNSAPNIPSLDPRSVIFASFDDVKDRVGIIALELAESGSCSLLVVDDCDDSTHLDLLKKITREGSSLRLMTTGVETQTTHRNDNLVLEIEPATDELIKNIATNLSTNLTPTEQNFVCELAQGFPRMAILSAEAVIDGTDTIGTVGELVNRIIFGRDTPDSHTLKTIQLVSLFTNVGVEHEAARELDELSRFSGVSKLDMYEHLMNLSKRGIVRRLGDYIEVTPIPLAAYLGDQVIEVKPEDWLYELYSSCGEAMRSCLLRRLRWLDQNNKAFQFAEGLLQQLNSVEKLNSKEGGQQLERLLHVAPDRAMQVLMRALRQCTKDQLRQLTDGRRYIVSALETLVFRRDSFVDAASLLRKLAAAENENWANNATGTFTQLYQLYLSGTQAEPEEKLIVLDEGLDSEDFDEQLVCIEALGAMLKRHHFSRTGGSESVGSDAPMVDWRPETWEEIYAFHKAALKRVEDIAASDHPLSQQARAQISPNIRGLLGLAKLQEDVCSVINVVGDSLSSPWIEAITAVNDWLYFDSSQAPKEYTLKIRNFYDRLLPDDPVELAVVYTSGWTHDLKDPDKTYDADDHDFEYSERRSTDLADIIAADDSLLQRALSRLSVGSKHGILSFAMRLGECADDPEKLLKNAVDALPHDSSEIDFLFFAGLLAGFDKSSHEIAKRCLDVLRQDQRFLNNVSDLLRAIKADQDTIAWTVEHLKQGDLSPSIAATLAYGRRLDHLAPEVLQPFVDSMCASNGQGCWAALSMVSTYQWGRKDLDPRVAEWFKRILLTDKIFNVSKTDVMEAHDFESVVKMLISHGQIDDVFAADLADQVMKLAYIEDFSVQLRMDDSVRAVLKSVIEVQPRAVWATLSKHIHKNTETQWYRVQDLLQLHAQGLGEKGLLYDLPQDVYMSWLEEEPASRLPFVMGWIPLTTSDENGELSWDQGLLELFDVFELSDEEFSMLSSRLMPASWRGSLADQLEKLIPLYQALTEHPQIAIRNWASNATTSLHSRIQQERLDDQNRQARFLD